MRVNGHINTAPCNGSVAHKHGLIGMFIENGSYGYNLILRPRNGSMGEPGGEA